jgi:hypothetical protein
MVVRPHTLFGVLIVLVVLAAGCISFSIGSVSYSNNNLTVYVISSSPANASLQIRVFQIQDLVQKEEGVPIVPVTLEGGVNAIAVPLHLEPGTYKLYIYLIVDGTRETAVIRDIVV